MNNEVEWNTQVTKIHHTKYVRNTRAITVAWFVFCACYTILNIVAFMQPFWFGDTDESPGVGYFGVYEWCERVQGSDYRCEGDFLDFNTLKNDYFRATSFLVGFPILLFIFSIICMLLFLFLKARIVLRMCGTLQLVAGVLLAVACIIYPNGWDDVDVRRICGQDATAYNMADCQIRWAYILAIVLIFDAVILATLAFVLAARQARELPSEEKSKKDLTYMSADWRERGLHNHGFSGNLQDAGDNSDTQQSLRKRHAFQEFRSNPQPPIQPFFREMTQKAPFESIDSQFESPLVIPVENFGDASNSSNRSELESPRSNFESPRSDELSSQPSPRSDSDQLRPDLRDRDNIYL